MRNNRLAAIAALVMSLFLVAAVVGLVAYQRSAASRPVGRALPSERAAQYREMLMASARSEAYLVKPMEDVVYEIVHQQLGPGASKADIQAAVGRYYAAFHQKNNKVSRPNPMARLGRLKQLEIAEARRAEGEDVSTALTGTPEVLTVMLNFSGTETYTTADPVLFNSVCLTDTALPPTYTVTIDGPQFNEIPQPEDNFTPWVDPATSYTGGFTKEYFEKLMYSTEGYTQTMRPELTNPWTGGQGYDYSGVSFRNYYAENSRGVYVPTGAVEEVTIPVAVSYFGASSCVDVDDPTNDDFHAGRPRYTIAISAAQQINNELPGFDWTAWDQEDVFDYNNNGDFFEPDGYVDHFFLIEAGEAEGGQYGEFLVWPHSWDVDGQNFAVGPTGNQLGGYKVSDDGPLGSVWVRNYTVSDEVGGLGVLVHEYGHDIGLPDNYSYTGPFVSNPGFWDAMDSGIFGGGLSGMIPTHMTIWDKAEPYLGWNNPLEIDFSTTAAVGEENATEYLIGQQSKPPAGSEDGLRIKLPPFTTQAPVEPFGEYMWWSDLGDDRNESIAQTFTPASGEEVSVETALSYDIEEDWDYLYWEVSSGATGGDWVALNVFSGTEEITTDTNPNGTNLTGDGITGHVDGWITATATVTPSLADGGDMSFRFRYQTDGASQGAGIWLDNISITGSTSGQLFFDDAESGDTWTHMSEGINKLAPWRIYTGVDQVDHSYLVEWRNSGEGTGRTGVPEQDAMAIAGFDAGLNRMYWIDEFDETGNISHVDPFHQHTPGMLVWYTDGRYSDNEPTAYYFDNPSIGPKGRVLLVDANPDPFYVEDADAGTRVVTERRSAFDAAFTLVDRPPFTLSSNVNQVISDTVTDIPGEMADPNFRDRIGSFPGLEGENPFAVSSYIDGNAGVVLPTRDNVFYWPYWGFYGDLGNPGLNAFGVNLRVEDIGHNGVWGKVKFWVDDDTVFIDKQASSETLVGTNTVTYTITLKDASGSRFSDTHYHLFNAAMFDNLPEGASLVPGSLTLSGAGSVFTDTSALAASGINSGELAAAGIDLSAVDSNTIVWIGELGGHRIDEPDAVITYAVEYENGCFTNETNLYVGQEMIQDDYRNGGEPFLWPKRSLYTAASPQVCTPQVYLPVVHRQATAE